MAGRPSKSDLVRLPREVVERPESGETVPFNGEEIVVVLTTAAVKGSDASGEVELEGSFTVVDV